MDATSRPRRRVQRAVLALAGSVAAIPVLVGAPPPAAAHQPRVLMIGDSTLAALDWYPSSKEEFAGLDYVLDAESCRAVTATSCVGRRGADGRRFRPANAADVLRSYPAGSFDELVLMVGYDEGATAFAESVVALPRLAADRGIDHITWLTFRTDVEYDAPTTTSYRGNNRLLRAAAASSGGFIDLVDWNGHVAASSGLVEADGVHLTAKGARSAAALIRRAIVGHWGAEAVSSSSSSSSSSRPSSSGSPGSSSGSSSEDRMTLSYGVLGPPVEELQEILLRIGAPALEPHGATGRFYAATRRAVREFQQSVQDEHDASMVVDGIVGPVTWRWLDRLDPG